MSEADQRRYGPIEIQDEDRRAIAAEGLLKLWDAMDLSRGGGAIRLPGKPGVEVTAAYHQVYCFVGEMLLGKDCPEKEVLTCAAEHGAPHLLERMRVNVERLHDEYLMALEEFQTAKDAADQATESD